MERAGWMVRTWKEECLHSDRHGRSSQDIRGAKALRKRSFRSEQIFDLTGAGKAKSVKPFGVREFEAQKVNRFIHAQ